MKNKELEKIAKKIRERIIHMAFASQSAHTGGCLSSVDILTVLYFDVMRLYPNQPDHRQRDRLIYSKAHDAKVLYAVLAERGFFPKDALKEYETDGGRLPGHTTRSVPGIEVSAGSLGHGLPIAAGMAYAGKKDKDKHQIFAVLSDGECDEGSTWEAILFAGHHKLSNLTVIVDYNKLQAFDFTKNILDLEPFSSKWKAFGWDVRSVNGHNIQALKLALKKKRTQQKPYVVIAHTIKGYKGAKEYINTVASQYRPPTKEQMIEALKML